MEVGVFLRIARSPLWQCSAARQLSLAACLAILVVFALALAPSGAAASTDCFASPHTCGYPDATNTGPTGTLTPSGSITASTNGQLIEGKEIHGQITVEADNVTIRNDKITATDAGSGSAGVWVQNNHTGTKVEDTTIEGKGSGSQTLEAAIRAYSGVTVENDNLTLCDECVQAWPLVVKHTYMKVSSIYSGAHAEDIYVCSGAVTVEDSTLINEQGQTATVFGDTICGGGNNFTVTNSLLAGGGFVVYPQANSQSSTGAMTITRNRFARCTTSLVYEPGSGGTSCSGGMDAKGFYPFGGYYGLAAYYYEGGANIWQGNVWDDNSQPVCADGSPGCGTAPPPTPPVAIWTAPQGVEVGVPVTLDGSTSTGAAPLTCTWSIESEGGSVLASKSGCKTTYTFAAAGTAFVRLTVTDAEGETASNRQSFAVKAASSPTPPVAIWTAPKGAEAGVAATLDGSTSTGAAPLTCTWSIESEGGSVLASKSGCKTTYTFAAAGTAFVRLTVTDAEGETASNRQSFAVKAASSPTPPVAIWTAPQGVEVGVPVTLDGSTSTGAAPLTCTWSIESEGGSVLASKSGCKTTYTFAAAGTAFVRLTVTDAEGKTASNRQSFAVKAASSPTPPVAIWTAPQGVEVGVPVTLDGSTSTGAMPLTCTWSFENESGSIVWETHNGCRIEFTFQIADTKYLKLTVTDAEGETASNRQSFAVKAASSPTPPVAIWTAPQGVEVGVPVTLDGSTSTGAAPLTCTWSIESEGGSVLASKSGCKTTYTFAAAGTAFVRLTVTDAEGKTASNRQSFAVKAASSPTPPVAIWTAPQGVEVGVPVTLDGSTSTGAMPLTCTWSFENESGSIVWETHNGCRIEFTFQIADTKYLKLTVTDAEGKTASNRQSFAVKAASSPP